MKIKVTGEAPIFSAHLKKRVQHGETIRVPYSVWDVNAGIPLGSARNIAELRQVLGMNASSKATPEEEEEAEVLAAIVGSTGEDGAAATSASAPPLRHDLLSGVTFFRFDARASVPDVDRPLNASLCAYDLRLTEGSMLFLSLEGSALIRYSQAANSDTLADASTSAAATAGGGRGGNVSGSTAVSHIVSSCAPLESCGVKFSKCGPALTLDPLGKRRLTKPHSHNGSEDSWRGSTALSGNALGEAGGVSSSGGALRTWSYRISTASSFVTTTNDRHDDSSSSEEDTSSSEEDEEEEDEEEDEAQAADEEEEGPRKRSTSTKDKKGAAASSRRELPKGFSAAVAVPVVLLGIADEDFPVEQSNNRNDNNEDDDRDEDSAGPVSRSHPTSFMLDVSSGAFYSGMESRPVFADIHGFHPLCDAMTVTFALSEQNVLSVVFEGQNVLSVPLPKVVADVALFPAVEIYTSGAVVELL